MCVDFPCRLLCRCFVCQSGTPGISRFRMCIYLDAPVSLSDNVSAKTVLINVLKNMTDDALVRFNNGTNDVAVFLESHQDALALCRALVTDVVFPESVFGSPVRVLQHTAKSVRMEDRANGGGEIVNCTEPVAKGTSAEAFLVQEICMGMRVLLLANPNVIRIANVLMILHVTESKL